MTQVNQFIELLMQIVGLLFIILAIIFIYRFWNTALKIKKQLYETAKKMFPEEEKEIEAGDIPNISVDRHIDSVATAVRQARRNANRDLLQKIYNTYYKHDEEMREKFIQDILPLGQNPVDIDRGVLKMDGDVIYIEYSMPKI